MPLTDLIQPVAAILFPRNEETEHTFNALRIALCSLNRHLKIFQKKVSQASDHAAAFDALQKISQLLNDFPNDKLDSLAVSIENQHSEEFIRHRDELFAVLDQLYDDIEEQIRNNIPRSLEKNVAQLDALQLKFETFFRLYHKKGRCIRFIPYFLYLLPLAFGYVAGIYLVFNVNDGVHPVSQEVIKPESAYHLVTGDTDLLVLSDQYNNQFWHDFSLYYFEREPNRFEANINIELKFLLKNKSSSASYLVSTISAEVQRIEAKPFPWERVIVTPDVRATSQENGVVFKDAGKGPALDFSCTGRTQSGMLIFTNRADFLYKDELRLQFDKPVEQVGIALVDKGKLQEPLFLQLQSWDQAKGLGEVFLVEGTWYETVETLERLKQLTTVSHKEELALTWQYRSLRQEAFQDRLRLTLPETQAYYVKVKNLRKGDPRVRPRDRTKGMRQDDVTVRIQSQQSRTGELIDVLQGKEPPVLKGIDLITKRIKLNVENLKSEHIAADIVNADTILNPSGYIIFYLALNRPENGSYQVRLSVNGNEIKRINIDALIPEDYIFNINDPVSLQRFHADR